jgi:hypothetical protein
MIAKQFDDDTMVIMLCEREYKLLTDALALAYNNLTAEMAHDPKVDMDDRLTSMLEFDVVFDELPSWERRE